MSILPSPPPADLLAVGLLAFIAGMTVPTAYAIERLNGFGRWVASWPPYQPPPGMDEGEAMQAAVEEDDDPVAEEAER